MQNYTHFEELIFQFCQRHRVGMIQPDEQLHYVIYVDDIEVRCFANSTHLYQLEELGSLPEAMDIRQMLLKRIAQQSLLDTAFSSCVLALNEDNKLVLYQRIPIERCQLADFEEAIADLVNHAEFYSELLQ